MDGQSQPVLVSVQVGQPRTIVDAGAPDGRTGEWTTAFFKQPVAGSVWLGRMNLAGDSQADRIHHGGPDKAVLAYSADHYPDWQQSLAVPGLPPGAFGENLTVAGLTEADVCIGDLWRVGESATVQVSQPRQPCWKLSRRWQIESLALQVQQTGRTGWYYRVLVEGAVSAGMPVNLLQRPHPDWTVARANYIMHAAKEDLTAAAELAAIPLLSENWRRTLRRRVERRGEPDSAQRLTGG